ncbi:DEAD/DEAH box helicase family protein [Roseomonas elaeocarpi]|uniref:Nucleoside kinase n=1 Tax=Roseomonas elaeocarpi TaxID=907779 RepID=A0ABV6JUJ0_9PROT
MASGGEVGVRNFLIEGVSGTGKTSVATELQRRGFHAIHGDRELAYRGDPLTGTPLEGPMPDDPAVDFAHRHHLWDLGKVRALLGDRTRPVSFFCGGSRNVGRFVELFDGVFVLEVDAATLRQRLSGRPRDEFGGGAAEQLFILHLHATREDVPRDATVIDATAPLRSVVDEILRRCGEVAADRSG